MEWKIIATHYIAALVAFLGYFITMLLGHWVFDQSGKMRYDLLPVHCAMLVLIFVLATMQASSKLEEISRELAISPEEKEALSPKLTVSFSPLFDDPSSTPYKYPLYEYSFLIRNLNQKSVPATDVAIIFSFKHAIDKTNAGAILDTGGAIVDGLRIIETEGDHTTVTEDEPLEIQASGAPVLRVKTRTVNGKRVNTNEAVLSCAKWPEGAVFRGGVVVNTGNGMIPHSMGIYVGKYHYQIKNTRFEEQIAGSILDPNVTMLLAESCYDQGRDYEKKEQYDEAIAEYDRVIEHNPRHSNAYFHRGLCYSKKKEYSKAILDCSRVIELSPNYADAYFNRGSAYAESKKYDEAIEDYTKYTQMNPQDPEGYITRGRVLGWKGENNDAISDFDKAIELDPKQATGYLNRGIIYARRVVGEYDKAISDYKKALELNPAMRDEINAKLWIAYNNRGISLATENRHSDAVADFSKAIELNPDDGKIYYNRALSWIRLGDRERAIIDMKKACDLGIKEACDAYDKLTHN